MLLTTRQVAEKLGVAHTTARSWLRRGKFPNAQRVGHLWMIPLRDVESLPRPEGGFKKGWQKGHIQTWREEKKVEVS